MKMIPQPYQQQQGAGGLIITNKAIRQAATTAVALVPKECGDKLKAILAKPESALVDCEYAYMENCLGLARVWTQLP